MTQELIILLMNVCIRKLYLIPSLQMFKMPVEETQLVIFTSIEFPVDTKSEK